MIRNRPLLGWGVGNFTVQYVQQKPIALMEQADLAPYAGAYTNDAHNDLLQVTAETGIVGAALAVTSVGLWFIAIFQLLRRRSIQLPERLVLLTCGCGVTVFLLDGLMSFPSRLPAHWMAFMVFQGIAAGLSVRHQPHPASARLSPAWFLPAVLLTLSLISLPYQARRVLAEWNLKSARQSAESIIVFQNGQPATVWDAIQFNIGLVTEGIAEQNAGRIKAASSSAKALVERPDLITALGYLARAERFDPRYTNATSRRSVVLMAQGRWREAGDLLDRIMLDLQSPEILDRRAICHYMLGEGAMAAALWLELAKRQPIAAKRHQFLATQALRPSLISASRDLSLPLPSQP
jgi:hypothetical protein